MDKELITIKGLIEVAKIEKSKKLSFHNASDTFDFFPDEIYELIDLEELDLSTKFNNIKFSKDIIKLKKLVELKITNSNFIEFPLELLRLESLEYLTINDANFTELPLELDKWINLKYLNLNECTKLNTIIGLPPNLIYLFLKGNGFNSFPEKVFELEKLLKLVAHNFKLKEIPSGLFNLTNLEALFLGQNLLSYLPNKILQLKKLEYLWLDDNLFDEFPEIINDFQFIEGINLSGNNLSSFPQSIRNNESIRILELSNNCFIEFPLEITTLTNLEEINLGNYLIRDSRKNKNLIYNIPNEILNLNKLKKLDVWNNPIENIPKEIIKEGLEAIKNFIKSKIEADNEEYLFEAKMVIVGRGDVGKTVLTKKLTNPNYSLTKSKSTKGISILKNPYEFKIDELQNKHFRFNIWDFGGQEKYDATHQLFITSRSVYLFLTEARDESNYQDVYYWLNTINLFSENSPVIIVLSKFDERKKLLPESVYKEKFSNIVHFVDVSCADNYEYTIENLKDSIKDAIKLLPQTKLTLSNHWIDIRNELESLSNHVDFIDYNEYLEICKVHKLDQDRADFLSEYLNDLGVIIHHRNDILLKNTIFINTDWCVDGMYKVLDDDIVFQNKGKFTNRDLGNIWKENRFKSKQAELIRLMCDYGLCFALSDGSGYIAPDLLPPDKPNHLIWSSDSTLQFEYQYTFMPAGMLSRFIVKSHRFIKDGLFWKYGVILEYDNTISLIEEDYIHSKIKISVKGENKKGLLSAIRMFIEDVHRDFDKSNKLSFEEMIPCNCSECKSIEVPHFYKFNVLRKHEQKSVINTLCENSSESVNIKELINDIHIKNPIDSFETDKDLKEFIFDLLETVIEKEVHLKGGYTSFWRDQQCQNPKDEVEIHPYICNTLDNYCKVRGINLSREVKEANGNVDIQFTCTNSEKKVLKVCVEVKKAHHQDVETAIATQLPLYMKSASTDCGIYLVIWFKNQQFNEPNKFRTPIDLVASIQKQNPNQNDILVKIIDCNKTQSPSKIKLISKTS